MALLVGRQILRWGKGPIFGDFVIALIVIAVVGSVVSVVGWIRRSRKPGTGRQSRKPGPEPAPGTAHYPHIRLRPANRAIPIQTVT